MHFYNFHVNDFRGATWHLNRLQRGIYRDLIDEYYLNESALNNDLDALAHKMACHSGEEKAALSLVLREFFTLRNGKWHHKRINREIKAFQFVNGNGNSNEKVTGRNGNSNESVTDGVTNSNAMSNAERQAKLREQAKQMKVYLNGLGVEFNQKMPFGELKKLFISNGGSLETVTENKNSVTESVTECNAENEAITNNQEPRTNKLQQQREGANVSNQPEEETTSPMGAFPMHLNWQPKNPDTVNGLLRMAKIPAIGCDLVTDALVDFVSFWLACQDVSHTAEQWDSEFVRSVTKFRTKFSNRYDISGSLKTQNTSIATANTNIANTAQPRQMSATAQSLQCLNVAIEAVETGRVVCPLPKQVFKALAAGLKDLISSQLSFPPAADAWGDTLNSWVSDFANHSSRWHDDDAERVRRAFQAAKREAQKDGGDNRFPTAAKVLNSLGVRLVVPELTYKKSDEEIQAEKANGRAKVAELLKAIPKSVKYGKAA